MAGDQDQDEDEEGDAGMNSTTVFVGIDVAKAHLDVAVRPTGAYWRVNND